jgi:hypothetical protein
MDINLGDKMRLFGRYTTNHFVEYRGDWTHNIVSGLNNANNAVGGVNNNSGTSGVTRDDQNGVLDWVYTLNASTILHAAASVSNWDSLNTTLPFAFGTKPSDVGLPSYVDQRCGSSCYLPLMVVNGYSINGIGGVPSPVYNRFWTYNGDVYHNRGNHSFRAGVDIRQQVRSNHAGNNDGQYTFSNTYFRQCEDGCASGTYSPATIGLSWASFMMGLPSGINYSGNDSYIESDPYYAWFVQDTWRVTPRLTLTLSLRGEVELGAKLRYNNWISAYDPNMTLPITSIAQAAYAQLASTTNPVPELAASQFKVTGGALYAGTAGAPDRAWDRQVMFLPRVGFGYQIDSKTVIRGGYGIYYDTLNVNAISYGPNQTGFSRSTNTSATVDQGVNWAVNGVSAGSPAALISPLSDPFPVRPSSGNTRFDSPLGNGLGNMALVGSGVGTINPAWTFPASQHPRMQRWSLSIERQIGAANLVSFNYHGAWTSDMNVNINQSAIPASYYYQGNSRPMNSAGATINCAAGVTNASANNCLEDSNLGTAVTNPFYIGSNPATGPYAALATSNPVVFQNMSTSTFFTSPTIAKSSLLRAFPSGNITTANPIGHSRQTEFDVSFNRRFSRGLTANFAYTHQDTRFANSYLQPWSGMDPTSPQSLVWQPNNIAPHRITATWVYDLPFGKGRQWVHSAFPAALVGGWTIAGTYQYQNGTLISLPNAFYYGDLHNILVSSPSLGHWFNTSGCVATSAAAGSGDTVVPLGQPCTSGWDKRTGAGVGTYQARVLPLYLDGLRNPGQHQTNLSLSRDFNFNVRDHKLTFQTRVDALNIMNHSFLGGVGTTVTSPATFGAITSAGQALNRFIQVQGHLRW